MGKHTKEKDGEPDGSNYRSNTMAGKFHRVKYQNCENEQILFDRSSTVVLCSSCGGNLTESTGGVTIIHGEIIETLSDQ